MHCNLKASDLLLNNFNEPLAVLAAYCQRLLDSDYLLTELVRNADIEWGRLMGERPYLERAGAAADPEDPCTVESIRDAVTKLLKQLTACE